MPEINLLVVDDEEIARAYVRSVIARENLPVVRVLEAADGLEAVGLCRRERLEAVLMDLRMPNLDGLSAIAAILQEDPAIHIVVMSAYDDFELVRQAFVLGARDYLLKPFGSAELTGQIKKMVAARRASEPACPRDRLVQSVLDYIDEHLAEPFTVSDLASSLYVNTTHLSRKLKKLTGLPLAEFIKNWRLARATELLADSSLSVTEVADRSGFDNPGYFATCFKKYTGRSPRDFRRAWLGRDKARLMERILVDKKHAVHAAAEDALSVARYIAEMSVRRARQKEEEKARLAETRLKQALQEADLRLLEAQINPHFLFNTLSTIEHLAYLEGARHISQLVLNLGRLLRTAIGKTSRRLIPLSEEMDLLRGYLDIQKARFGLRLKDRLEFDPSALDCLVPGMTLQPLVENSIQNSVESGLGHCLVEVKARKAGGRLTLTVADNGPGLKDFTQEGCGLRSVKLRLRHYFGDRYHFDLRNRPRGGALAEISLPDQWPGAAETGAGTYEVD